MDGCFEDLSNSERALLRTLIDYLRTGNYATELRSYTNLLGSFVRIYALEPGQTHLRIPADQVDFAHLVEAGYVTRSRRADPCLGEDIDHRLGAVFIDRDNYTVRLTAKAYGEYWRGDPAMPKTIPGGSVNVKNIRSHAMTRL